jgi:EAL domain-containing protein (putative c-di-GMP-specific phosphodiesterase class I)
VETVHGDDIVTLFDPFIDVITLRLVVNLSPDLQGIPGLSATVTFQIIELRTNAVVFEIIDQKTFNENEVLWNIVVSLMTSISVDKLGTFSALGGCRVFKR